MYREYAPTVYDRRGLLLPESEIRGRQGYISVYGFDDTAAAEIKASGHSRGMRKYPVGSSTLIMDFDNGLESAEQVSRTLTDRNVTHWVFESGGKGAHIYANCESGFSAVLPNQHYILATDLSPHCDPCIYRHDRLIRLPGTVHERTGKRKALIHSYAGTQQLTLPPPPLHIEHEMPVGDKDALYFLFSQLAAALETDVTPGNRHEILWRLANDCHRAGLDFHAAVSLSLTLNAHFKPPKDSADVLRVVEARYK